MNEEFFNGGMAPPEEYAGPSAAPEQFSAAPEQPPAISGQFPAAPGQPPAMPGQFPAAPEQPPAAPELPPFEQQIVRLEQIVSRLEHGDAPLAESLTLFEEGTRLAASCARMLDQAEQKVVRLMKGPDGSPVELPFEDTAESA